LLDTCHLLSRRPFWGFLLLGFGIPRAGYTWSLGFRELPSEALCLLRGVEATYLQSPSGPPLASI